MIPVLVLGLIALPLLGGLVLAVFARKFTSKVGTRIALVATELATLCALILLLHIHSPAGHHIDDLFTFAWLPNTGEIGLHLSDTGLTMALVTSGSLFLAQLFFHAETQAKSPNQQISKSIHLIALSAANIAFLSSNFLGRYVALEVVGVCIALVPLLEIDDGMSAFRGMRVTRPVYLALRVGDVGFLAAILLLMQATGTLDISAALKAGAFLLPRELSWLVAGFLLAVWVKVGAWPFHSWLQGGQHLNPTSRIWLYGIVMPNLGVYLLYRVTPLLTASKTLWHWVFWFSVLAMGIAILLILLWRKDTRRLPIAGGAFLSALALCFAALGLKTQVWWVAVAFAPLQVLGQLGMRWAAAHLEPGKTVVTQQTGFPDSSDNLPRIAQQVRRFVEVGILEQLVIHTPRAILSIARWLHRVLEQGTLEGALRAAVRAALAVGHGLQRLHTGRLRGNLGWMVAALVAVVVVVIL